MLTQTSAPVGALVIGLPFGFGAAAIAGLFVNSRRRKQTRLFRAALNNMTQGLCMFDSAARLVLCNRVYIDMYHLRPEHARPGTPLRDLLMHRLTAGNFQGDPDRYVAEILREAAENRTETKTLELKDGRVIALASRPMRGVGCGGAYDLIGLAELAADFLDRNRKLRRGRGHGFHIRRS